MTTVLQTMLDLETMPIQQMVPVPRTTLVDRVVLALRTTPGRRMTTVLQTTKEAGAEAKKVAERTSEQDQSSFIDSD
jgi:hypothetical protein